MKQMSVGAYGYETDTTEGVKFDGHILDDESVEFHFSCVGHMLDSKGYNFDLTNEIADFNTIMNACNQDSELGMRLYNAFRSAVYNMLLGFQSQTLTHDQFTLVTIEDDGSTKLEIKSVEA